MTCVFNCKVHSIKIFPIVKTRSTIAHVGNRRVKGWNNISLGSINMSAKSDMIFAIFMFN